MPENKFIQHLKGKDTAKSVLEIKNQATPTSFANMPTGTSDGSVVYSDPRGNATAVLKGTDNWKLSGATLVSATTVYGDGRDLTGSFLASGNTLWVNATYAFASAKVFTPNTKWVLKLCGHSLDSSVYKEIPFSLVIKIGNSIITKQFNVREEAFEFCKEFVIDFAESETAILHANIGDTMNVQLLCGDASASATIYNGMSVLTALQRRVDSDAVSSNTRSFDELEEDFDDLKEDYAQFVIDTGAALDGKVNIDGTSIMTAPLKFMSGSVRGAVGPYFNGVGFWKLDSQGNLTQIASISDSQFIPTTTSAIDIGNSTKKWKDLYLGGKAYVATLNNGADLTVPNKTGTLATMGDVELAARSGRMLTDQGVWYAKMYSATVPPAAENGTNYADFSQVDGDNNPIIVIYERQSGAWVQVETITPPAEYDGYVPITSKIWDIAEQSGQQGGRILWNHISKEFTPYPTIISFEDIEITGTSTVIMPLSPTANQIVNKDYVDSHIPTVGDGTITITQGGETKGTFTTNQSGNTTIDLDAGGAGGYHPDLFAWEWSDALRNDVQWLRADTFSWQAGSVYEAAYKHLRNDMYQWYSWEYNGTTIYTKKRYPEVGEKAYTSSALTTEFGTVTAIDSGFDGIGITVGGNHYDGVTGASVVPTTETIAGVTVQYIPAADGHKIVTDFHTSEVEAVYAATGEAWYYIIDYGFYRFKLPRSKHNKYASTLGVETTATRSTAVMPTLTWSQADGTNITSTTNNANLGALNGHTNIWGTAGTGWPNSYDNIHPDNLIAQQTQNTDQYKYLYFYVGEFTQEAIENTAGINTEDFNDKADTDFGNTNMIDYVVAKQNPSAGNGYTWYRKYKSGWVEQGGFRNYTTSPLSITLPVEMADTNYTAVATESNSGGGCWAQITNKTTTTVSVGRFYASGSSGSGGAGKDVNWQVSGMAQG